VISVQNAVILGKKKDLKKLADLIKNKSGKVKIVFPKESELKLSAVAERLRDTIDEFIFQNVSISVENIPYCFLVGYKRYIAELKSKEKIKTERCKDCKHYGDCSGIWKAYIARYGDREIFPITGKHLVTDNERCMLEILLKLGQATTKQILELKNSPEFRDICAHCVGSDDVMLTGKNLMAKGLVKREFTKEGFLWKLVEKRIESF